MGGGTQWLTPWPSARLYAKKNTVPNEPTPFYPSGVRLGTPAVTTRGMKEPEMAQIAAWIAEIEGMTNKFALPSDKQERRELIKQAREWAKGEVRLTQIRQEVNELCARVPMYA